MVREISTYLLFVVLTICLCLEAPLPVTITSDAGSVVCVNTTITLTCNATGATKFKWTTDHSELTNNNTDTITVTATPEDMQYTCVVTDGDGNTGRSCITVVSNDSIPVVDEFNFNKYEIVFVGGSINLTVEYSPDVLTFKWYRFHAPLPPGDRSSIINYSVNGKNYSSLILSNMTDDDWGLYIFIANSHCGTSSVNVTLNIKSDKACFNGPIPIMCITSNQTTIRGERAVITFECLFGGNYSPDTEALYSIFWTIISHGKKIYIDDNSDEIGYVVTKPSQHCPPNNDTCCQFASYLHINTSVESLSDETVVTCNAIVNEYNSASSVSSLTVLKPPVLMAGHGPHDATVNLHEAAEITCAFTTSEVPNLSICAWSNEDGHITPSDKYHIKQASTPGRDNQIDCTLTVSNVTKADEGRYYCYCYYNESFWEEYHFPKHANISSQRGRAKLQLTKKSGGLESHTIGISVGSTVGLLLIAGLLILAVVKRKSVNEYIRRMIFKANRPVDCSDENDQENSEPTTATPHQVASSNVEGEQSTDQIHTTEHFISGGHDQLVEIVEQPQNQTVYVKEKQFTVTLCCHAKSLCGQQLNYKWYCLHDNESNKTIIGCNSPLLKISVSLSIKAGRRFYCEVSAGGYTISSDVAEIKLETVWIVEEPKLVTKVFADDSLELSCKAESAPGVDVTYLWFKCYQDGQIEELAERCLGSKMVVSRVTHSHQGYYKCVISPEVSSRVACVEVMSQTDIKFKTQPPHHQRIEIGKQLILSCEAACENYPVNYQWYHNKERLINANRSQLVIPQLAKEDIGFYHCDVRSEYSVEVISSETTRVQLDFSTIHQNQLKAEKTDGYARDKMALLIGNGNYKGALCLRCPHDDVKAMAEKLQELGFKTLSLVDVSLNEMSRAIDYFCSLLQEGMYAVFYYSGHGLDVQKTTYLMPVDANGHKVKTEECVNYDDVRQQMQQQNAKVIAFLDCCRTNDPAIVESSLLKDASITYDSVATFYQIYACAPSCEAFEIEGRQYSFLTQAVLEALSSPGHRKKVNEKICPLIIKYYREKNVALSKDKPYARPWILNLLAEDISLEDPIYVHPSNDIDTDIEDLLLKVPKTIELYFNQTTMRLYFGCIQLDFVAEFSNVLIVHITCKTGPMLPDLKLNLQELETMGLTVSKVTQMSYRISNLLVLKDAVQNSGTPVHLRFSFTMPHNITVTDKIEYELPSTLINLRF